MLKALIFIFLFVIPFLSFIIAFNKYMENVRILNNSISFDLPNNKFIKAFIDPPIKLIGSTTLNALRKAASQSIKNQFTGNRYFLPITVDSKRAMIAVQQYCSLLKTGFPNSAILYIGYDESSCHILREKGATCTVVDDFMIHKPDPNLPKYHLKTYLLYIQNLWGLDAYIVDSDILFFDHIEKAFFNNNIDIEMSSDDRFAIFSKDVDRNGTNSGFGRFLPTSGSARIIEEMLNLTFVDNANPDQAIHVNVYHKWRSNYQKSFVKGIETWKRDGVVVKFRNVDPLNVPCGGLAVCVGRTKFWNAVEKQTARKYPVAIHFNYNLWDKYQTYQWLGVEMCNIWNMEKAIELKSKIMTVKCVTRLGCENCYIYTY